MISIEVGESLLGIRSSYKFYSGALVVGSPTVLLVGADLGRASVRGRLWNDDAAASVFMSVNDGDRIELKAGDNPLPLDSLKIGKVALSCTTGTPSFRLLLW